MRIGNNLTKITFNYLLIFQQNCIMRSGTILNIGLLFTLITASVGSLNTFAQRKAVSKPVLDSKTILMVGNTKVPTAEFNYVYKKNNAGSPDAFSQKSLREYLELYINFRLKVLDAQQARLDTTAAFRQELESYREQLSQPYLTEKSVTEKLIRQAYDRMKEEINASHILILADADADPSDTLAAWRTISDIRKKAIAGEDFAALARQYSQDPSAAQNAGNLGYFTALQMVYPFEDAAFSTAKNQVSKIIRTKFGYHILKVYDRRASQGQVRTAHIMVKTSAGASIPDSIAAKKKIEEIYSKLQKGESWNSLCSQFSDDQGSKSKNGELPSFGAGQMIPAFEQAAFGLGKPEDISSPFKTPYGWHIIKLLERKPLETFAQLEPTLRTKISKDSRSDLNRTAFIARLKREYVYKTNEANLKKAIGFVADTSFLRGNWKWKQKSPLNKLVLFSLKSKPFPASDFFKWLEENQTVRQNKSASFVARQSFNTYIEQTLTKKENLALESKYEDFDMLLKEYRDGILLFQLMDQKVWSKGLEDTVGLKVFYQDNKNKYNWDKRAKAVIYNAVNRSMLDQADQMMKSGSFEISQSNKMPDVLFEQNSIKLTSSGLANLRLIVNELKSNSALTIAISGHSDKKEKSSLAKLRAKLLSDSIIKFGIEAKRIKTADVGNKLPANPSQANLNARASIKASSNSLEDLERELNAKAPLSLQITQGLLQKGENGFIDGVEWKIGRQIITNNDRVIAIEILNIEAARLKTFEEAKGALISDYQNFLDKQWVDSLRKKYVVKINEAAFSGLVKK